jgi:hypothetical protein
VLALSMTITWICETVRARAESIAASIIDSRSMVGITIETMGVVPAAFTRPFVCGHSGTIGVEASNPHPNPAPGARLSRNSSSDSQPSETTWRAAPAAKTRRWRCARGARDD